MEMCISEAIRILGYPPEFVSVLERKAEAEFDLICYLLSTFQTDGDEAKAISVIARTPKIVLLGFKLWLRIHFWERSGMRGHINAGLPSAEEVLAELANWRQPSFEDYVRKHSANAIDVLYESTLWSYQDSQHNLAADFVLSYGIDDEQLLESVATLLIKAAEKGTCN